MNEQKEIKKIDLREIVALVFVIVFGFLSLVWWGPIGAIIFLSVAYIAKRIDLNSKF
jgi:F0F1-type ATP synthase membrane subunit b/b'